MTETRSVSSINQFLAIVIVAALAALAAHGALFLTGLMARCAWKVLTLGWSLPDILFPS